MKTKSPRFDGSIRALGSLYWNNKTIFICQDIIRVISQIAMALTPLFIGLIAGAQADKNDLLKYIIFLAVAGGTHSILWIIADVITIHINPRIYKIREIVFDKVWKRDYQEFVSMPTGKSAATSNRLYENVERIYDNYVYIFTPLIISMPVFLVILFTTVWQNALIYILFMLFASILVFLQSKTLHKARAHLADNEATEDARNFDSFSNFVNVKSFNAVNKEKKLFNHGNRKLIDSRVFFGNKLTIFWGSASISIRIFLWAIILFFNYYLYDHGRISFGAFIIAVTILVEFTNQFWGLVEFYGNMMQNVAAYKANYNYLFAGRNIVKEYYDEHRHGSARHPEGAERVEGSLNFTSTISFNNLSFAYPDRSDTDVLKNINLTINKGEKIGIVGKSGSGKSTLVKLILGFYETDAIKVDGNSVSKEELALLNCYVPQDTTLFQQTVEFNIAYAKNNDVTHEEVVVAAKKAHAHEFIMSLKDGYDTLVGERGIKLSLGQRQRIALARAFLKNSELLILDEATSSLDSKTESLVQESLEELWKNRTVLAVAHRLSTLNNVDRIIVIDKGEIVEQGTKTELLNQNGVFTELWNHQRNGMLIDDDDDADADV